MPQMIIPSASVIITKYVPRARTASSPKNADTTAQIASDTTIAGPSAIPDFVVRIDSA